MQIDLRRPREKISIVYKWVISNMDLWNTIYLFWEGKHWSGLFLPAIWALLTFAGTCPCPCPAAPTTPGGQLCCTGSFLMGSPTFTWLLSVWWILLQFMGIRLGELYFIIFKTKWRNGFKAFLQRNMGLG